MHGWQKPIDQEMLERVARITLGFSGAELENVLNEATLNGIHAGKLPVTFEDIERMVLRVSFGASAEDEARQEDILRNTPYETLYAIAVHELGHLYTSFACPLHAPAVEVSIMRPTPEMLGYTRFQSEEKEESRLYSVLYLMERVRVLMGGRAAEYVMFGAWNMTTGASGDWDRISDILRSMTTRYGFLLEANSTVRTSINIDGDIDQEQMRRVFDEQWEIVTSYLRERRDRLESHAHELVRDRKWNEEIIQEKKIEVVCC
jgi:cell division protease FtsH